jgi:nitroreductase
MHVTEAMIARRSTRAFLSKKVEREKLEAVLKIAARAPSWANSQPWEVFVATGGTLERIKKGYAEKYAEGATAAPEIPRPKEWPESAKRRQKQLYPDMVRDCGEAADQFGRLNQTLFGAPAVIYICMDSMLTEWSLYDIGAYALSLMLAAVEQGLSTIPAITLMLYPDVLRRELRIPDSLKLTIGIAIGYADNANRINNFTSARDPIGETVRFLD